MSSANATQDWIDALPVSAREQLLAEAETQSFKDGELIYRRGARIWGFYMVVSGKVEIQRGSYETDAFILRLVYPGGSIGMVGMFSKNGAVNAAVARGPTVLKYFPRRTVEVLGAAHPDIYARLMDAAGEYMAMLLEWVDFSLSASAAEKVVWNLQHLSRFAPLNEEGQLTIKISQQSFARMMGLSRQVANQQLNRLAERGVLSMRYGGLEIDADALALEAARVLDHTPQ